MRKRIEDLERIFDDKINIVACLIGDTQKRKLNIEERQYIGNYIEKLYKLAKRGLDVECDNLLNDRFLHISDKV